MLFHALHHFFVFHSIPQHLGQSQHLAIGITLVLQRILYPLVGNTTHMNQQVRIGDGHHVGGGGLEAVQVHAILHQEGQFHLICLIAQNVSYPVIFREDGGYNPQGLLGAVHSICLLAGSGGGLASGKIQSHSSGGKPAGKTNGFLHIKWILLFVVQ